MRMGDLMASRYRGRERERMKKEKEMKRVGDMDEEKKFLYVAKEIKARI